jgi:putative hemolysin
VRIVFELSLILVLLGVNAVLAASEAAIISLRKTRLREIADGGNQAAKRILQINEAPGEFLATIQIGITLAGFFAAAVGAVSMVELADDLLSGVGSARSPTTAASSGSSSSPRSSPSSASSSASSPPRPSPWSTPRRSRSGWSGRSTRWRKLTRPARPPPDRRLERAARPRRQQGRSSFPSVTRGELLAILETAEDEGVVEGDAADLAEEALGFGEIQVRSVMVPRVDVVSLDATRPSAPRSTPSSRPASPACRSTASSPTTSSASSTSRTSSG